MSTPTPTSKHGVKINVGDRIHLWGTVISVNSAGSTVVRLEDPDLVVASQLQSITVKASMLAHS